MDGWSTWSPAGSRRWWPAALDGLPEEQVAAEVRRTVIHEVGHYFGIDDGRLGELGW